jgi:hypothetical protein
VTSQSFCESGGDARLCHAIPIVAPHQQKSAAPCLTSSRWSPVRY